MFKIKWIVENVFGKNAILNENFYEFCESHKILERKLGNSKINIFEGCSFSDGIS